jgi:hypothetical protein
VVKRQLEGVFASGLAPQRWILPTHPEVTPSGNLGRLLDTYPEAEAIGDMRDLPVIWPQHVGRMVEAKQDEFVDLGSRRFFFVERSSSISSTACGAMTNRRRSCSRATGWASGTDMESHLSRPAEKGSLKGRRVFACV